jgi:hypothetical protein
MAANPPKAEFSQQSLSGFSGASRRWIRRKAYFLSGYVPLDPGDYILCEKLLEVVGVYTFASENRYRRRKSAAKSARTASFRLLAVTSGSGRHLGAFSALQWGSNWRWGPDRYSWRVYSTQSF